ncbi:LysM peptidoglycan-binding domain-containing protein [Paenibacillus lutimineralis]|uniref:LysM peptidoglycan-binding domain-containing protein n=1 Tax=Paenibacillus lutimineralis TaxID=2707005 RepID=A0A3Q9IBH9_9BACL|nr:LysM peptidoglycan-binding domain-containing protein [Paenibacillus lutimineralis]AZS15369.1 LysM peptidoglycan-binding domain-containing protein [Paenibacillus lutimineralis]
MKIHLIDSAGNEFIFPVNPEELKIARSKGIETVNILSLGEFDFPSGERVKEITFSSFFPIEHDSGYCNSPDIPDPIDAMQMLTKMTASKQPVRLIITDTPVNVLVLISAHDTTFKGGEPGDIYFDLTARTWRQMKVHTKLASASKTTAAKKSTTSRTDTKKTPKTYTVKSGDSLSKIAKMELGSSAKWQAIYNLNKKTIGKDPNKIKPGMKLVMPT